LFVVVPFFYGESEMTQAELNRAVAGATGESVETITRRGFSFVEVPPRERDPLAYDWDEQDARQLGAICD